MRLNRFLESLIEAERQEFNLHWHRCRLLLTCSGSQRQFAINLEAECWLCEAAWMAIRRVISSGVADSRVLQGELTLIFRQYPLQSEMIPAPKPAPLGRAVTVKRYAELLREQFGFNSPDELNQFMADLLRRGVTAEDNRAQLHGRLLSRPGRVMWATFDILPDGKPSGANPFNNMSRDADDIRAQLGLDPNEKGEDLLLFIYELPATVMAYYPTLAEAYAGDVWPWYFRPGGEAEPCGFTMPWPEHDLPPQPEVVHEPISGNNLVEKVGQARGIR